MKTVKSAIVLFIFLTIFFIGCASMPSSSAPDDLDMAIRDASDYLNDNLPAGSKFVILNVQSGSAALSDYIIDELIANAVNDNIFTVVDRTQLDLIREEQYFQLSGEVDDDQALSIGKFFGAQYIILGVVSDLGERYRMRIRALNVQTSQVQGQYNRNIAAGPAIIALMKNSKSSDKTSTAYASRQALQEKPAKPERPANGTYTFYPRLRAYAGAAPGQAYISHIVVRGEYMNIYITGAAQGSYQHPGHSLISIAAQRRNFILQDLNNPSKSYNPEQGEHGAGWFTDKDYRWIAFKGVTAKRFSLTFNYDSLPIVWEEIILAMPDS